MLLFPLAHVSKASLQLFSLTVATKALGFALTSSQHTSIATSELVYESISPPERRGRRVVTDEESPFADASVSNSRLDLKARNWVPRPSLTGAVEPPDEGPYSLSFHQDSLLQWIFGDTDQHFNISISTCIGPNIPVGRYRFADGHIENDVTKRRIYQDLQFGSGYGGGFDYYAQRTISNAQDTLTHIQALLGDKIVCGLRNNLVESTNFNRRLLTIQGNRVAWVGRSTATLVLGALGIKLADSEWKSSLKVGLGTLLVALGIILNGLIIRARDRGQLAGTEAAIASIFVAVVNKLTFQASQPGSAATDGECVPETELTNSVDQIGSYGNRALSVVPLGNDDGVGLDCPAY